ncbi:MAG: amidase [Magnetovibrio sp.]|nr:amidase [Magnetovibrio sp.]
MSGEIINTCDMPATRLVELYELKTVSPVEAVNEALARIANIDGDVNAYCLVDEEAALAAAKMSESRWMKSEPQGLADGVPLSVKDIVLTKGHTVRRGSRTTPENEPDRFDCPAVGRLREHGAVIIGRTTTPEYGWKGLCDSPLTGITRNPWDTSKTPGGSSGGAAVSAALGMAHLNIGTDGGGSVRIPAAFTGVFGFKATFGRVPVFPPSAMGTLSHVGPLTRTVEDAAMIMNIITQPDSRDWSALPHVSLDYRTGLDLGMRNLSIAFSPTLGYAKVAPEVASIVADAVKVLEAQGAVIDEVDPDFDDPKEIFSAHWDLGAARLVEKVPQERRIEMDPGLLRIAERGWKLTLAQHADAVDARVELGHKMNLFHETYDLLVTPAMPIPAFTAGQDLADQDSQNDWMDWSPFTYPFNLTGQPACVVPCGFTALGLPVGLQIVGARYADPLVLRAASAFEEVHPFQMPEAANVTH